MGEIFLSDSRDRELLERFVSALERIAEAYETQVVNQSKVIDQTLKTMKMATEFPSDQQPY